MFEEYLFDYLEHIYELLDIDPSDEFIYFVNYFTDPYDRDLLVREYYDE